MTRNSKFRVGDFVRDVRDPDNGTRFVKEVTILQDVGEPLYGVSLSPSEEVFEVVRERYLGYVEKPGGRQLVYGHTLRETKGTLEGGMTCLVLNIEEKITVGAHMTKEEEEAVTAIFQEGSEACSSLLYEIKRKAVEYLEKNAQ